MPISTAEKIFPTSDCHGREKGVGRAPKGEMANFWQHTKGEEDVAMFIVIISFPPIKPGKDDEFREWFAWSNKEFANH